MSLRRSGLQRRPRPAPARHRAGSAASSPSSTCSRSTSSSRSCAATSAACPLRSPRQRARSRGRSRAWWRALERGGRLIYVGAGTAGRLGMLDAAEAGPTFDVPPGQVRRRFSPAAPPPSTSRPRTPRTIAKPVEGDVRGSRSTSADVVIGIAASGRTPYVLGAVAAAARRRSAHRGPRMQRGQPRSQPPPTWRSRSWSVRRSSPARRG